jgi:hypothetical protein
MTLILAAQRPKPFILVDLMLTHPGPGRRVDAVLPSTGVLNVNKWIQARPDTATRYFYSGLVQKLCVINEYLVIGWARSMLHAKSLIRRLKEMIGDSILSAAELNSILTSNTELVDGHLSLICLGLEGVNVSDMLRCR